MQTRHARLVSAAVFAVVTLATRLSAASPEPTTGDQRLADYFRAETARLAGRCLTGLRTLDDWTTKRAQWRAELLEMLGLSPLPPRTDLQAVVTGRQEAETFTVERLHFQSRPGLYVTANLYLPKGLTRPAPTILYVCGHGPVITNGISYGNKVSSQHHGAWFARNGYVCLVPDTLQLGEIQGVHHGTYREGMWWWNTRGYTPAGVEAWNNLRALDYLSTRPEVDTNRFGVTGRSGGGAYSWTLAALDERVRAAAPVAGITDLENYVVDGAVEGHCDCMFTVNTYRWDYPQLAALVAPRPLLLVNTDADNIFPLDGVERTHAKLRRLYELYGAKDKLGLVIGPGPHKDTQDLQLPVFRWFNQHLKGEDPVIEMAATKFFTPQQLKVFAQLPADALNPNAHETFVPSAAAPAPPQSEAEWAAQRDALRAALTNQVFRGWPETAPALALEAKFSVERRGVILRGFEFTSQEHVRLRFYVAQAAGAEKPARVNLNVLDATGRLSHGGGHWLGGLRVAFAAELTDELAASASLPAADEEGFRVLQAQLQDGPTALVCFSPRGLGADAWSGNERAQTHRRRRFMLLGQTLDGMRVWDIRRATQAVRELENLRRAPLTLSAREGMACNALFAALFEPGLARLDLLNLPASLRHGPDYLNALRFLDVPQAVALAVERAPVLLHQTTPMSDEWHHPAAVARNLGWDASRFRTIALPPEAKPNEK